MALVGLIQQGMSQMPQKSAQEQQLDLLRKKKANILSQMQLIQETGTESTGYGDIALKHLQNLPEVGKSAVGSGIQAFGEHWQQEGFSPAKLPSYLATLGAAKMGVNLPDYGAKMREEAESKIARNQPYIKSTDKGKQYISDVVRGVEEMAPALSLTLATKSPAPMLGQAGLRGYTQSYGEQRDAGRTPTQATFAAIPSSAAEVAFERLPIGALLKEGTPFLKRAVSAAAGEGVSEALTESVQAGIEAGTINPNMTLSDYLNRVGYAGAVGAGAGAIVSAPAQIADRIRIGKQKEEGYAELTAEAEALFEPDRLALSSPEKQLALPSPEQRLGLPKKEEQLALPSPDYSGVPLIATKEGLRYKNQDEFNTEQRNIDLGKIDVPRLSAKAIEKFRKNRIKKDEQEYKEQQKQERKQIRAEVKEQNAVKNDTLLNFIAENDGIKLNETSKGDLKQVIDKFRTYQFGRGDIISKKGKDLDRMRELAVEARFLPEDATIDDFIQAVDKEVRGEPVRRPEDIVEPTMQDYLNDLQIEADKLGVSTEGKTSEQLFNEMTQVVKQKRTAIEQAIAEDPMLELERQESVLPEDEDFDIPFFSGFDPSLLRGLIGTKQERAEFYAGLKKSPKGLKRLGANLGGGIGTALLSIDDSLRIRAKINQMPTINRIADMLYGGTEDTYGEAVRARQIINHNKIERNLKPIRKDKDMLERTVYLIQNPKEIVLRRSHADNAAANIAALLNNERQYLIESGVEVGEVEGYFPRVYDLAKILRNENDFLRAAKLAYKATYPDKTGADAKKEAENWYISQKDSLINKAVSQYRELGERVATKRAEEWYNRKREELIKKKTKEILSNNLSESEISEKANAWLANVKLNNAGVSTDVNDLSRRSGVPRPSMLKERALSKEADQILKPFLVQDPQEVLTQHFISTARKAEFNRRFSPEKWESLKKQMIAEATAHRDVDKRESAFKAIESTKKDILAATGNSVGNMSQGTQDVLSWVKMFGAMGMLPHAVLTALPEAVMPALRAKDVRSSFAGLTTAWRALMKDASYLEQKELAEEVFGVVAQAASDMAAEQRMGGELGTATTRKLMAKYFTMTGLHGFTEGMRLTSVNVGRNFINRLAREYDRKPKKTELELRELGIAPTQARAFSEWVLSQNGGKPSLTSLNKDGEYQRMYKRAVTRFADQSVIKPEGAEKPRYASHRIGSLFYYLQSFIYGFQKNVIMRQARNVKQAATEKGLNPLERASLVAPIILTPIILGALQYGLGEARDELLDSETKEKMSDEKKTARAISRTGYYGQLDPWVNLFTGLRYRREPATTLAGPVFGGYLDTFAAFGNLAINNSSNTNTQERKAAKQFWRTMAKPMMTSIFTAMPGKLGVVLNQMLAHPQTEEEFIQSIAGKKRK